MRRFALAAVVAAALTAPLSAVARGAKVDVMAQAPVGPNTWTVDTGHSSAGFSVKHLLVSTVRGTLGPIKGTVDYDGKSLDSIKADITIDVSGVNTNNENRDRDLKGADFFDVAKFPTVTFKSKRAVADGAGKFKLIGDLTMHGVTKEVTLDVEGPSPALKQPNGSFKTGASATTTINRKDFGMQFNSMVEAAPVVSDEVKVTIDLELNKRPATAAQY